MNTEQCRDCRLMLAVMMMQSLLTDEQIASAPILILGNKIDLPGAASEDEIRHLFGLHTLTTGKVTYMAFVIGMRTSALSILYCQSNSWLCRFVRLSVRNFFKMLLLRQFLAD